MQILLKMTFCYLLNKYASPYLPKCTWDRVILSPRDSDGSKTGDDAMAWCHDGAPARVAVMALDDAMTRCRSDMTAHIGARDRDGAVA